jgi:hypothetical protein
LKESLCKEKDAEVQELFNQHKEQVKQLQNRLTIKNNEASAAALKLQWQTLCADDNNGRGGLSLVSSANSKLVIKLQREIKALKEDRRELELKLNRFACAINPGAIVMKTASIQYSSLDCDNHLLSGVSSSDDSEDWSIMRMYMNDVHDFNSSIGDCAVFNDLNTINVRMHVADSSHQVSDQHSLHIYKYNDKMITWYIYHI